MANNLHVSAKEHNFARVMQARKKKLVTAIILTILLVAGIPLIVMGAQGDGVAYKAMLGIGIAFVVIGFYGAPIMWTMLAATRAESALVSGVIHENLHTVQELSIRIGQNEKQTRATISNCVRKGFLAGYKIDGDTVVLNENASLKRTQIHADCPRCGGSLTYFKGEVPICPYCNSKLPESNN